MTNLHPIDVEKLLADQLATASPDLLYGLLSTFIAALMNSEADYHVWPRRDRILHRPREARACPVAKRRKAKPIAAGHSTGSDQRRNPAPRTNY
jgi:hypothetical protein